VTPSWYDVLDVAPDATTEEIRAAWRSGVADLDPTDRRFKSRSSAAEVLLDPDRRAAHDADLAADAAAREPEEELAADSEHQAALVEPVVEDAAPAPAQRSEHEHAGRVPGRGVPRWLRVVPAALGVLALLLVVVTVVAFVQRPAGTSPAGFVTGGDRPLPDDREVAAARSTAESAVVPILTYDYRRLDDDQAAAGQFMTDSYRKNEYDPLFAVIKDNAPRLEAVVSAQLLSTAVVRTGPGVVDVLAFVNRPTTRKGEVVQISRDQVVMRMVEQDDTWLVDCLITAAGGTCGD